MEFSSSVSPAEGAGALESCLFCADMWKHWQLAMADRDAGGVGSARLRRERRLPAMLQLERPTVAMELATALHHSRDVEPVQHDALRGTKDCQLRDEAGHPVGARAFGVVHSASVPGRGCAAGGHVGSGGVDG